MVETLDLLMDAAEAGIRQKGYNGVSFRELADELGIKSASVHYYFRKKEDLGLALMRRYSDRFFQTLNERAKEVSGPVEKLRVFCDVYRDALVSSDAICLGGMLGAETCTLPDTVAKEVAAFFQANIDWLEHELPADWTQAERTARAGQVVATLQGLMMMAASLGDQALFDQSVERLCSDILAN